MYLAVTSNASFFLQLEQNMNEENFEIWVKFQGVIQNKLQVSIKVRSEHISAQFKKVNLNWLIGDSKKTSSTSHGTLLLVLS